MSRTISNIATAIVLLAVGFIFILASQWYITQQFAGVPSPVFIQPPNSTTPSTEIDTSGWVEYRNEEYGFAVKYPQGWALSIHGNQINITNGVTPADSPSCAPGYEGLFIQAGKGQFIFDGQQFVPEPDFEQFIRSDAFPQRGSAVVVEELTINGRQAFKLDPEFFEGCDGLQYVIDQGSESFTWAAISSDVFSSTGQENDTLNQIVHSIQFIDDTSNWQTYRNEELGIRFTYPRDWGRIVVGGKTSSQSTESSIGTRAWRFENPPADVLLSLYVADNADAYFYCGNFGVNPCDFIDPPGDAFEVEIFCRLTSAPRRYTSEVVDSTCDTSGSVWKAESISEFEVPEASPAQHFIVRALPPTEALGRVVAIHATMDANTSDLSAPNPEAAQLAGNLERILFTFEFIEE